MLQATANHAQQCRLHYAAARYPAMLESAEAGLASQPRDFELHNLKSIALRRLGRYQEAVDCCLQAARLDPGSLAPLSNLGNLYIDLRDGPRAVAVFTELVQLQPANAEWQRMLAVAQRYANDFDAAERHFRLAIACAAGDVRAWIDLALLFEEAGRGADALQVYGQAASAVGDSDALFEARMAFLRRQGQASAAIVALEQRIAAQPTAAASLYHQLGRALLSSDRRRANLALRHALALAPDAPAILTDLAESLDRTRGADEGDNIAEAYQLALRRLDMAGDMLRDARVLRAILIRSADFDAAAAAGTAAVLGPYWARSGQEAALQTLIAQVRTARERRDLVAYHRLWGKGIAELAQQTPLTPRTLPHRPIRRSKIRIGFMSSDLRNHPVAYFAAPLLLGLDRKRFEVYCYSWNSGPVDAVQQAISSRVDAFRQQAQISDRAAAQLIAADAPDVLFELGGSTDMNRIRTMAWRPARRQASWLGYPHSCGLEAIDRILTDPFLTPADPQLLIERPLQLAHSWVAFGQPGFGPVATIDPLTPQERCGHISFGTMNNPPEVPRGADCDLGSGAAPGA